MKNATYLFNDALGSLGPWELRASSYEPASRASSLSEILPHPQFPYKMPFLFIWESGVAHYVRSRLRTAEVSVSGPNRGVGSIKKWGALLHSGALSRAKMALCKLKKGTLYTSLRKSGGTCPLYPRVPTSMGAERVESYSKGVS